MSSASVSISTRRLRPNMPRFAWLMMAALLIVGVAGGGFLAANRPAPLPGQAATEAMIAERWGIKITHIAVLADGGLIDFRFQVLDPDKSAALFDLATRPVMVVESTGKRVDSLYHPPHGHNIVAGQSQYFIYNNSYGAIQSGSSVSIVLGDLRLEHVIAQ